MPPPNSRRGGSPGAPSENCATAGRAAKAARTAAASNERMVIVESLTASPNPASTNAYYGRTAARQAKPQRATALARLQPLGGKHQLLADPGLHRRVSGIRHYRVTGLRPSPRQFVGAADRADHVVAALHDRRGQMADTR